MATFKRFEEIEAWQLARELCKLVYKLTSKGEFAKDFAFKNQIRDAAGSAMDNIAEGYERDGTKEFINFLSVSKGSSGEVRSQSYRAFDIGYVTKEEFMELYTLAVRVSKANAGLMEYLKACELKGIKWK
jgi:four helix bundle protein